MIEKTVWLGERQVSPGQDHTTTDGIPVRVLAVDPMSGKLTLAPRVSPGQEALAGFLRDFLSLAEPPSRIGAEVREA